MKTTISFQKLIRKNREKLEEAGLNKYTIRSWAYGYRSPDFFNANIISRVLDIDLHKLFYSQRIYHKP